MDNIFDDLLTDMLRITAVHVQNQGIKLDGILKETIDKSTPDEIANTEIALLNADYQLKEIEAKDGNK